MLALKITRRFETRLREAFGTTDDDRTTMTTEDALVALGRLTYLYREDKGQRIAILPQPDEMQSSILNALGLSFPRKATTAKK